MSAELGELDGVAVGIGPVDAAVGTTRALLERRPTRVVLVGSCGAFPGSGLTPGSAVWAGALGLGCVARDLGLGYRPGEAPVLHGGGRARVLTNPAITTDEALARLLGADWHVEHMEAWAVARACQALGVPCEVVLGVANEVGPGAHEAWRAHRAEAEAAARRLAVTLAPPS